VKSRGSIKVVKAELREEKEKKGNGPKKKKLGGER